MVHEELSMDVENEVFSLNSCVWLADPQFLTFPITTVDFPLDIKMCSHKNYWWKTIFQCEGK